MNLTKEEIHVLQHSLGLSYLRWYDKYKVDNYDEESYRNYFYTSKNTTDYPIIQSLTGKELMFKAGDGWENGSNYFSVTKKGIEIAIELTKKELNKDKPSRSKRRYELYMLSECEEPFIEWLQDSYWKEYRKRYGCT